MHNARLWATLTPQSYLIGLWFSLRTHAAQIWQNPQQLMKADEQLAAAGVHPSVRQAVIARSNPTQLENHLNHILPLHKDKGSAPPSPIAKHANLPHVQARPRQPPPVIDEEGEQEDAENEQGQAAPSGSSAAGGDGRKDKERREGEHGPRLTSQTYNLPVGYTPVLESVDQSLKQPALTPMRLPPSITTEEFTRAVAVATVSALRHQGSIIGSQQGRKERHMAPIKEEAEEEGGGHEAPSWTRGMSAGVLLACTLLYALIAETLVDQVDVVLKGSGIEEKFLGLTLFALVPNTTEFMNAMSFALTGNIALSMEIGSAYALQVCLLQIPAMVAFSALYDPHNMGEMVDTFT